MNKKRIFFCVTVALALVFLSAPGWSSPQMEAAKKWVDNEFQPSTLTKEQQMKEMEWFIKASAPFKGMKIKVVSETIPTHEYEAKVLTKAFEEITGIKVAFDLIQEGDVIEKLQTQWASGKNIYDGWVNDSDLIGIGGVAFQFAVDQISNYNAAGLPVNDHQIQHFAPGE